MKLAVMAIGLPGSGKTTLLKPFALEHNLTFINRDDIRDEIWGDARDQRNNKVIWEEANRRTIEALRTSGVALDATFVEKWKRESMIEFLRSSGADRVVAVFFDVPFEVANERNQNRDRVVPQETMEWMRGKLTSEPPSLSDGFDALYTSLEELEKHELN